MYNFSQLPRGGADAPGRLAECGDGDGGASHGQTLSQVPGGGYRAERRRRVRGRLPRLPGLSALCVRREDRWSQGAAQTMPRASQRMTAAIV